MAWSISLIIIYNLPLAQALTNEFDSLWFDSIYYLRSVAVVYPNLNDL